MTSLNAEQKQVGSDNYYEALGVSRRDFLKGVALAGVTSGAGLERCTSVTEPPSTNLSEWA